ncbi:type VI secretion lipoprotein/VasD [Vibrio ponticus]|nr:type VI secretion lipoprotein/VasD [Vibrio ponticus]
MRKSCFHGFLTACLAFVLMACSSSDDVVFQPSISVPVEMQAVEDINTFDDELARPLVVRLYQLRDSGAFESADFVSIYESGDSVLAGSLVDSKVMTPVLPGEARSFVVEVQQDTKYIAVFAEFADYEVATAKSVVALVEEPDENPIIIKISQASIEISQPVDSSWW